MNYLTSNFNLLDSNSHWEKLKKNHTVIDKKYNGLIISLNKKNLSNFNYFHSIFYIDNSNFNQTIKELKSMIQIIKKNGREIVSYLTIELHIN